VLLRADGVPTYNFGVVSTTSTCNDTRDPRDDHVNNTPRQIHIIIPWENRFLLSATCDDPRADGERLSKRHGRPASWTTPRPASCRGARQLSRAPRLSHGDAEIFTMEQFKQWFDLEHVNSSPARFDLEKLKWLNSIHQGADVTRLANLVRPQLPKVTHPPLEKVISLVKERVHTSGS